MPVMEWTICLRHEMEDIGEAAAEVAASEATTEAAASDGAVEVAAANESDNDGYMDPNIDTTSAAKEN